MGIVAVYEEHHYTATLMTPATVGLHAFAPLHHRPCYVLKMLTLNPLALSDGDDRTAGTINVFF